MKMWAVFGPNEIEIVNSRGNSEWAAIRAFLGNAGRDDWEQTWKPCGYRCRRITVTVEGES